MLTAISKNMHEVINLTCAVSLVCIVLPKIIGAETKPEYSAAEIIARVGRTYAKTVSAKGTISRVTDFGEGEPERAEGTFRILKPNLLTVSFAGKSPRTAVFDGATYRLFFPSENRGYFTDAAKLTTGQRFVLGAGPFFGNIFDSMADTFSFEAIDLFEGNLVVKAVPEGSSPYSYVLIGVSPETWTIRIVEYFGDKGEIVRQIRYLTFKSTKDGAFFPTTAETSTVVAGHVMTETVYLSNLTLNDGVNTGDFARPGDKDTRWASEPFDTK